MKAFWAVLAALILAGGGFLALSTKRGQSQAQEAMLIAQKEDEVARQNAAVAPAASDAAKQVKSGAPSADELATLKKQQEELASKLEVAKKAADELAAKAQTKNEGDAPADASKKDEPKPEAKPDATKPDKPATPPTVPAEQPKPSTSDSGFSVVDGTVAPVGVQGAATKAVVATVKEDKKLFAGYEIIPAKIETKDNGILVDGKYLIKGEGTAEKPYVVPWDVLTSVEETFDPQSAKKKLPERVTMLDGKVIKLSGYIAFPMMMKEAKECLAMLNQWDGCCIGTPPTPYDAVEVSLKRTISGDERFTTSGAVIGTFRVKPYLQGDWLIGLYVMETGDLKSRDFGGAAGN